MKKFSRLLICAAFFALLTSAPALAHPPSELKASWNDGAVTVSAKHKVADTSKHYILALVVTDEKGRQLAIRRYTKQADPEGFKDTIPVDGAKSGMKLRAQLICNIMGENETSVTVP